MKVNKIRMRETVISYAFLAPVLFFFVIFVLAPMIMGFITSFFNYSMTSFEFVGLDNYIRMFKDPVFTKSLINTVILVIGSVPVVVLFSLFVASQTYHQNAIARSFYRFVFFLPVVTGSVAVTVVWKWIYDPLSGILNFVLKSSHIITQNISWLGDKHWALMAIMIILLTTSVGQPIILYIAAMGNIDNSLVEAARSSNNPLHRNHHNNQLIPMFRLDSAFDIWWAKLLYKYLDVLPLRKSLPIDRVWLCQHNRCLLGSHDCDRKLCSI